MSDEHIAWVNQLAQRMFNELCIDERGDWRDPDTIRQLARFAERALDAQLTAFEAE